MKSSPSTWYIMKEWLSQLFTSHDETDYDSFCDIIIDEIKQSDKFKPFNNYNIIKGNNNHLLITIDREYNRNTYIYPVYFGDDSNKVDAIFKIFDILTEQNKYK